MIISELLISCGVGQRIARLLSPITKRLFRVGEAGACAYILGTLCGFPIGARTAASLYDRGDISSRELERILVFCNNPSPAFIISTVGASVLGRTDIGILIYACVTLSAITVGIFSNLLTKSSAVDEFPPKKRLSYPTGIDAQTFTSAVRSGAISMLTVCAYVVFFSTVVGCIGELAALVDISPVATTMLFGFFELSLGSSATATIDSLFLSAVACALFAGWSGMSVHFQIMSVTAGRGVSYKPYLVAKAAQGLLCAALCALALKLPFSSLLTQSAGILWGDIPTFAIGGGTLTAMGFIAASLCPFLIELSLKKAKYNKNLLDKRLHVCYNTSCNN